MAMVKSSETYLFLEAVVSFFDKPNLLADSARLCALLVQESLSDLSAIKPCL